MPERMRKTAKGVLEAVGGVDNVIANSTCMTRLRITVSDSSLIDIATINELDGVLGCVERGVNGIEVILGPRTIQPLFEAFSELTGKESGIEPIIGSRRPQSRLKVHIAGKAASIPAEAKPADASEPSVATGTVDTGDTDGDSDDIDDLVSLLDEV